MFMQTKVVMGLVELPEGSPRVDFKIDPFLKTIRESPSLEPIQQPIKIAVGGDGKFYVQDGVRRLVCAWLAGVQTIPVKLVPLVGQPEE